ncbi:universal stress protein [Streptomyces alkaliterrae]|uniref:Universal stress protein n=1 Tax=Streptomyces alkaliterrae TaxID=2213162 RepID=A0A5P0YW39_9ACTN|nr:universal stress protein [Streptomyces alkaliterrae]MBB1254010.1 universal stress protein [Streptomyces alkaliterrae]MBB1259244.1 universal stress protein [Streptomyces alkaliterrae]MQS04200.1 universal stress protein [Streptomyces alkaliterrae]
MTDFETTLAAGKHKSPGNGQVVVGVDGSPSSLAAVAVAAREARLRGCALRIVHAFLWPVLRVPLEASPLGPPDGGLRNEALRLLRDAVMHAAKAEPDVEATSALVTGEPLTVLEKESRTARLMVVGSRGLGGFVGLLLGSTAVHLAAHGHCPVLVVRGTPVADGPVLLAVDGSPAGAGAVEFAFAEASLRGAELLACHVWNERLYVGPGDPPNAVYDPDRLRDAEERLLAEALAGCADRYPDVRVTRKLLTGRTRPVLIETSRQAQLTVVGARGRGGFAGLLLGSVSQALLHHAESPVAVVRVEKPSPELGG